MFLYRNFKILLFFSMFNNSRKAAKTQSFFYFKIFLFVIGAILPFSFILHNRKNKSLLKKGREKQIFSITLK